MKSQHTYLVAIEGPSGAGKSTLTRNLGSSFNTNTVAVLPEFSDVAGGPEKLPRAPAETYEEELDALRLLLGLDQQRLQLSQSQFVGYKLGFMDRSVHTLLAHRFALGKLTSFDTFEASCRLAKKHPGIAWPDIILYVDTPQNILTSRRASTVQAGREIFIDPHYNKLFREYFIPTLRYTNTRTVVLDGRLSETALTNSALAAIPRDQNY